MVTTGTFLNGLIHIGPDQHAAGRLGEPADGQLGESLKALGMRWGRLKTGTPPRLSARSIDVEQGVRTGHFHVERGDSPIVPFSFMTGRLERDQVVCHQLHTTERVHQLVRQNLSRSPLYNGQISGIGPRYCPSIEDKVVRFPEKARHHLLDTIAAMVSGSRLRAGLLATTYVRSMAGAPRWDSASTSANAAVAARPGSVMLARRAVRASAGAWAGKL